jgi:hypothetical protein
LGCRVCISHSRSNHEEALKQVQTFYDFLKFLSGCSTSDWQSPAKAMAQRVVSTRWQGGLSRLTSCFGDLSPHRFQEKPIHPSQRCPTGIDPYGLGVGEGRGLGVGVTLGLGLGVAVDVAVGVAVGVNVAVAVGVGVNVAVAVGVGVNVAVAVGVGGG